MLQREYFCAARYDFFTWAAVGSADLALQFGIAEEDHFAAWRWSDGEATFPGGNHLFSPLTLLLR
jgi:hypothetical protein